MCSSDLTLGVQIIEGSLFFEYGDSSSISGAWDFNVVGNPENIGPQTGEGEYIGTVENNQLSINLNPEWEIGRASCRERV